MIGSLSIMLACSGTLLRADYTKLHNAASNTKISLFFMMKFSNKKR